VNGSQRALIRRIGGKWNERIGARGNTSVRRVCAWWRGWTEEAATQEVFRFLVNSARYRERRNLWNFAVEIRAPMRGECFTHSLSYSEFLQDLAKLMLKVPIILESNKLRSYICHLNFPPLVFVPIQITDSLYDYILQIRLWRINCSECTSKILWRTEKEKETQHTLTDWWCIRLNQV